MNEQKIKSIIESMKHNERKIRNVYAAFLLIILFSFLGVGMYEIAKHMDKNKQMIESSNDKR
jgi:hypothetical protein